MKRESAFSGLFLIVVLLSVSFVLGADYFVIVDKDGSVDDINFAIDLKQNFLRNSGVDFEIMKNHEVLKSDLEDAISVFIYEGNAIVIHGELISNSEISLAVDASQYLTNKGISNLLFGSNEIFSDDLVKKINSLTFTPVSGESYCNDNECILYEGDALSYLGYNISIAFIDIEPAEVALNIDGKRVPHEGNFQVGGSINLDSNTRLTIEAIDKQDRVGSIGHVVFDIDPINLEPIPTTSAYKLDFEYDFYTTGKLYFDWSEKNDEKWLQSETYDGSWLFILPNGEVYFWNSASGKKDIFRGSELVGKLQAKYYDDPKLLIDVEDVVVGGDLVCYDKNTRVECADTDNGNDRFNKGYSINIYSDRFGVEEDECLDSSRLREYYCHYDEYGADVKSATWECKNGCLNGACVPNEEEIEINQDGDDSIEVDIPISEGIVNFNLIYRDGNGNFGIGKANDERLAVGARSIVFHEKDDEGNDYDSYFVATTKQESYLLRARVKYDSSESRAEVDIDDNVKGSWKTVCEGLIFRDVCKIGNVVLSVENINYVSGGEESVELSVDDDSNFDSIITAGGLELFLPRETDIFGEGGEIFLNLIARDKSGEYFDIGLKYNENDKFIVSSIDSDSEGVEVGEGVFEYTLNGNFTRILHSVNLDNSYAVVYHSL